MSGVWHRQHSGYRCVIVAAPTSRPRAREVGGDVLARLVGPTAGQPPVRGEERAGLVDRHQHGEVLHLAQVEVLAAAARRDVDEAGALVRRDLVPHDHPVSHLAPGAEVVEGTGVAPAHELAAQERLHDLLVAGPLDTDPVAVGQPPVPGGRLDGHRHVGRERPRRGGPDHDGLAGPVEQREADRQRRVLAVDVAADQLVGRDRRAAARAPLRGAMAPEQPPLLLHDLQEPPDVLDVGVGEREVVVPPVHPLPEADRPGSEVGRRALHHGAAAAGEVLEPVLLDLALGVEPELLLHADLDPEPLAVEAVLVALVVPAERLVALEHVLQRAAPGGVHREGLVGRDGPVDEAEPRAVGVLRPQPGEGLLALPALEDRQLERVVIRLGRQGSEHERAILRGRGGAPGRRSD